MSHPSKSTTSYTYPFAPAPDIIRANQKDTSIQTLLHSHLSTILRKLYGSRFAHNHTAETQTFTHLLYLALTTLVGNRTLGEEYCGIVQVAVEGSGGGGELGRRLPDIGRRAGYIVFSVLVPYVLAKGLPGFRRRVRVRLEGGRRGKEGAKKDHRSTRDRVRAYVLENLSTLTSPSPLYALTLSLFYFTGSYYHLSKRLFGLRYIFTKRLAPSEQRAGYEVLGVLLVLQMAVQSWLHIQNTLTDLVPPLGTTTAIPNTNTNTTATTTTMIDGIEVNLSNHHQTTIPTIEEDPLSLSSSSPPLLLASTSTTNPTNIFETTTTNHSPLPMSDQARYDLQDPEMMTWMQGRQHQRKCTLCLEPMKDPSVTTCGHVFCWTCIGDWVREKPECPLCRQGVMGQHILPLRG